MLREKVDEALEQFEAEVIDFLQENPECETTDKKGKPVLQYVGADYKATYDFQKVRNVTFYHVLRIK